jgi:hypothetical protein
VGAADGSKVTRLGDVDAHPTYIGGGDEPVEGEEAEGSGARSGSALPPKWREPEGKSCEWRSIGSMGTGEIDEKAWGVTGDRSRWKGRRRA